MSYECSFVLDINNYNTYYRPGSLIEVWSGIKDFKTKHEVGSLVAHISYTDLNKQKIRGAVSIVKKYGLEEILIIEYNYKYFPDRMINRQIGSSLKCTALVRIRLLTDQPVPNVFFNVGRRKKT